MSFIWNHFHLALMWVLLFYVTVSTGQNLKETEQPDILTGIQQLTPFPQIEPREAPGNNVFLKENMGSKAPPMDWSLSSSEEIDRQGVLGEYSDVQESSETSLLHHDENGLALSRLKALATNDVTLKVNAQPKDSSSGTAPKHFQEQSNDDSAETGTMNNNLSVFHPTKKGEDTPTFQPRQNETADRYFPLHLLVSLPTDTTKQDSLISTKSGLVPEHSTLPVAFESLGMDAGMKGNTQVWTPSAVTEGGDGSNDETDDTLKTEAVMETEKGYSEDDEKEVSKSSDSSPHDGNSNMSTASCNASNQTGAPIYPNDFMANEYLRPSLSLSFALFIPLYSDWNSALATWGFAWEAHIYGLGSVFTLFSLISVVCLLGLPLRCPPGGQYFTLLQLFLLAFTGIKAFCLLYDAYSHQDRLPPLSSLLLSQLPFPCLISAFSLSFLLLSLHSRKRLSLPVAASTSFSALPNPCLLLCISLLHFGVSLACVGLLVLFQSLPTMILLLPQGLFVCLTLFLSCAYLIFYCLIQANKKHMYRLNDGGESGGSPEMIQPANCPFAKVKDWGRAAWAGVWASLCLLGCGGLQLYGILHALNLDGIDGYGFLPWPWWGYQIGCRLSEVGVCLGLSLIGTHPLFCHNNTVKTISHPRPGSWSRLSCSSPSRGLTLLSQEALNSPVLSSHVSFSQDKQEKLVVCDAISKGQSEALPLHSVDPPGNETGYGPQCNPSQTVLPQPSPPSQLNKSKNVAESQPPSVIYLGLEVDSTGDLRPPSPIDLSRSIDQALFSESLFSHSIFGFPGLFRASSSHSLSSPSQGTSQQEPVRADNSLYRTSSCGVVYQENHTVSISRPPQCQGSLKSHKKPLVSPELMDWKGSASGSTLGLCKKAKETRKHRSHSWVNRGQSFAQSSLPRAIPHLSCHRRYQTLSLASRDSQVSGFLAGTKHLSESKQLEWDRAVQAEFVNVCRQIDALSVCSDTIEL